MMHESAIMDPTDKSVSSSSSTEALHVHFNHLDIGIDNISQRDTIMPEDSSQPTQQPSSLKSRLEAFQAPSSSSSSANNDSQRPRVASGSLKDRIALFNANAESSKPLIPTAAFGTSAPPPGGPISRTTGGGMIGNRLPKLDPSSAGLLSRNVAQPVGARKVSENRGLVGNRIPNVTKQHTGGSTTSVASSSDVGRQQSVEPKDAQPDAEPKDVHPEAQSTVPEPRQPLSTSADLEEDAVDMEDAPFEARDVAAGAGGQAEKTASVPPPTDIPIIRAEDLVPSTLPHDDDAVSSDISEPPSPRSTAAQGSETTPSMSGVSDLASNPAISRISSSLSVATDHSVATTEQSNGTLSSLRVETGGPEEEAERQRIAAQEVAEDQDNLSEVSTPTRTPMIQPRDHLPEISGSLTHAIGGLSLHPDGTVSPGAFGTSKKMPELGKHEDEVMVDMSALPAEIQKLRDGQRLHEQDPTATDTEMNRKGDEPESKGDFQIMDDKMVHIELPQDDAALTEEGRQLQKLAKKKLADEAEKRGTSEWQVMEQDAKDRPDHVKREQEDANEEETGDRYTSFQESQASNQKEYVKEPAPTDSGFVANKQDETAQTPIGSKDFASGDKLDDGTPATEKYKTAETPLKSTRHEGAVVEEAAQGQSEEVEGKATPALETETPSEVIEPATPFAESEEPIAKPAKEAESATSSAPDRDESTTVEDITDFKASISESEDIQDIEDIPTIDDTELHKKDQDPNVDSLIVGKHDDVHGGVQPKVEITEEDTVEDENEPEAARDTPTHGQSQEVDAAPADKIPASPASVPSEIEEPLESPAKTNENVASATFPSVPKQDPKIREVSDNQTPEAGSRASTPAQEDVTLPSVPTADVNRDDPAQGKVRVEVTLSPGKHLASPTQNPATHKSESEALDEDMNRFLAKKDGGRVERGGVPAQDTASLDALAGASADKADAAKLAKSTSSSSTLSSSSSTSSKKKKSIERGRSPLLDMDTDGDDDGEAGWAKVSVNKTKYA
ncbi:hypothetical protein QFC21_005308 [Naganishia friedmannii]|uniref:Uncharacterized protein n=1 Tax=Naganishia friedmannii TaxID=89922 RepID=A0ACC2VA40_9TREE|nr:hypothetical protein QFC21_005308 [Naganishia friedmannii]